MNGKQSLEKYHSTVPCRMCEYDKQERNEMPCLMCVVSPDFEKDILKNEYRKFTLRKGGAECRKKPASLDVRILTTS